MANHSTGDKNARKSSERLTRKQKIFADAFLANGGDGGAAAVAAGYSDSSAAGVRRIMERKAVSAYIAGELGRGGGHAGDDDGGSNDDGGYTAAERVRGADTRRYIFDFYFSIMSSDDEKTSDRLRAASYLAKMQKEEKEGEPSVFELPARLIGRAFADINREIVPNVTYIFAGGRGSGKSSFISLKIIELLMNNPMLHACVVRKLASTLRGSVYAQIEWAICALRLEGEFKFKKSPLAIIRKTTGQTIYFRGSDNPKKLKSIKPRFGYIGILWKEEADQLSGEDEVRSINQSVLRGGSISYDFCSFNPPKSKNNWANLALDVKRSGRVVHHSSYKEMPGGWLGQKFLNDAEDLMSRDLAAYEHEYLGKPTGDGGSVFEKLEIRRITDDEIAAFDRIAQGVDFGWYPDSYAFLRTHYDAARERIYIIDELYVQKKSNTETGEWILEHGYADHRIVCDSAEPKSISDYRGMGIPAVGALKGAGSVAHVFRWLQSRTIVIDPERTPDAYREIVGYEYERAADGTVIGGYPDVNDHAISALRYAYEAESRRR